ncbi:MAG: uridine kinase [Propionicimonas sp.]|uniref:uridine kinase family protein n=1 Tax=Propionicimonas sp. TaxID=1955623 RepID=UPI003D0EE2FC
MTASAPRLVLIAGASGSGKSRLAHRAGCPSLRLDDFYFDADHPDLPRTEFGIPDWDDPRCWDADGAVAALRALLATGRAEVPAYSISESRRTGVHEVHLDGADCLTAEGIFAIEFLATCRAAGLDAEAIYLDRPGFVVFVLRLRRDLAKKRKPPLILLRRGLALWRAQPALKRKAVAAGFEPLSMPAALARLG